MFIALVAPAALIGEEQKISPGVIAMTKGCLAEPKALVWLKLFSDACKFNLPDVVMKPKKRVF